MHHNKGNTNVVANVFDQRQFVVPREEFDLPNVFQQQTTSSSSTTQCGQNTRETEVKSPEIKTDINETKKINERRSAAKP